MKRVLLIALAAACAQQESARRTSQPAAAAMESGTADGGVVSPGGEPHKPAASSAASRSATPAAASGERRITVAPEVRQLSSGLSLLELPANRNAIVNVQLQFRTGSIDDPRGKAGLTYLTARVMTEGGTQALSAKQLLEALFPLAAELDVRVDKELTTFRARVHRDNLAKLLPILSDVVLHPRWDPEEFRRLRDAAVNDIEKRLRQGDDENLGKETLQETMFRGHPYERLTLGHASELKSMTLQELQQHAGRVFTADRLTIGVAGGYPQNLGSDMAQVLSTLPARSQPPPAIPQAQAHRPRFVLVEKISDSTAISIGMPWTLSRKDPDWPAMSVARSAFGEHRQTNGRLMQRLREMRGLNYGDYAYIEHFRQEGGDAATAQTGRARQQQEFTIWLRPVRDENRLFALRAALYELARTFRDEPFSAQEVEQTKGFLDGYILLFDQTDARKLGYALDDQFYGMKGFLAAWREAVRDVTADQVNRAWRKWVDPTKLEIVLAGKDMASVKKALLAEDPTPIQYQKDATGKTPEKPAEQLATDKEIAKFPFGAKGDADAQVIGVDRMFE
ncbi:MAG TPA: pitrilysin family protein [Myxococcales bacterium]|jgi:zinc protease|nr:pitrilysin family protein [Myxococcales bacterium]